MNFPARFYSDKRTQEILESLTIPFAVYQYIDKRVVTVALSKGFLKILRDKDYFVLTTNVDHCFQKAGFDKERLFYTQGDYGLFQCSKPCHPCTYDNEKQIRAMFDAQGFSKETGLFGAMTVPAELLPRCPICGRPMSMNLRSDSTFVEDDGWHRAAKRYREFLDRCNAMRGGNVLFLELGVGMNTPGIIKYPFWQMTALNSNATYACINYGQACAPDDIGPRSISIDSDIGEVVAALF
jgi:NAD-dependent SIR2 family protein deacetylase